MRLVNKHCYARRYSLFASHFFTAEYTRTYHGSLRYIRFFGIVWRTRKVHPGET